MNIFMLYPFKYYPAILLLACLCTNLSAATLERPDNEMRQMLVDAVNSSDSFNDRFEAEVWMSDMSRRLESRIKDPQERLTVLKIVHYEATRAGLEPELVLALINVESNFDRFAISSAGALGLMQIMPFWLNEIGRADDNLLNINTNLRFGCTILGIYLKRENGNMYKALARYNGSTGQRWYPNRVYLSLSKLWYRQ